MQRTQSAETAPTEASSFPPMVCPIDRLHLVTAADAGELMCTAGHGYPVEGAIPRLAGSQPGYADAFGEQWRHYRTTQLDSYTKTSISRDRLERCLGEAGFTVERREVVGSEWREFAEESGERKTSRQLLHVARLIRARDLFTQRFGRQAYEAALADRLWGVYQMIGKLSPRVYVLA